MYRNSTLTKGVKRQEQKKNPQNPMTVFRPRTPATRHSAMYKAIRHGIRPI